MNKITYIKDNKDVSTREVEPIGFTFQKRDLVLCIDVSNLDEEQKAILQSIRDDYIDTLYDFGFGTNMRSFHLDGIEEVT